MKGTKRKINKKVKKVPYTEIGRKTSYQDTFKPYKQDAYFNYRRKRKTNHEIGENRTKFAHSVMAIYKAIAELMLENEGGVFLEEYGYFTATVLPWSKDRYKEEPLFHSDGYYHQLSLYTSTTKKSCIKGMIMDKTFYNGFRKAFHKKMLEGDFVPKLYKTSLKSVYGYKKSWTL